MKNFNLLTILGPTASGKTRFAAFLAYYLKGEIISADSRQLYRNMNIGTGKDYDDYMVNGENIPYYLIDIIDAGYQYNVFQYQQDFFKVYNHILNLHKLPILCGGSGMYIEAVTSGYKLIQVPENKPLREKLKGMAMEELKKLLSSFKKLHNITDTIQCERLVRAIEIETYYHEHPEVKYMYPDIHPVYLGIKYDRQSQRNRITERLKKRLKSGMIEEVEGLLKRLSPDQLTYYGLEYKYITLYLTNQLSYEEMYSKLETAIHQFAKRQMTWFRKMERKGLKIHWFDGYQPMEEKIDRAIKIIANYAK